MNTASKILLCLLAVLALGACKGTESIVTVSYEGAGRITEGTKIDCGSKCTAVYTNSGLNANLGRGYDITLTATPAAGFELFTWVKGCGASLQCKQRIASICNHFPAPGPQLCQEYVGVNIQAEAVFVPAGSVAQEYRYGTDQNCLVDTSGILKCWGPDNFSGSNVPTVSNPVEVQLAKNVGCVRSGDNKLHCWGNSSISQVPVLANAGQFTLQDRQSCYLVGSNTTCYRQYACALDGNALKCWGAVPAGITSRMPALNNPVSLRADNNNVCVQDSSGDHCWGDDFIGQTATPALNQPTEISASGIGTCALTASGLRCWGFPTGGGTTDGSFTNATSLTLADTHICVGDDAGMQCFWNNFSPLTQLPPALQDSRRAKWVGYNLCGLGDTGLDCWNWLGDYNRPAYRPTNLPQADDFDVTSIGACGIKDRTLACWGETNFWPAQDSPTRDLPLLQPKVIAINHAALCVGGDDGLYCRHHSTSTELATSQPKGLQGISALAMSSNNACALHNNGVTCWGSNQYGVADVPALQNPRRIALGDFHACALDDTGVVCWGEKLPQPE